MPTRLSYFEQLRALVLALKPVEYKRLKRNWPINSSGNFKSTKLIRSIREYPDRSENEIMKGLDKTFSKRNWEQLCKRSIPLLMDGYIEHVNAKDDDQYPKVSQSLIKLNKYLLNIRIQISRNNMPLVMDLLDEVIEEAKRFEHYDELLQALYIKSSKADEFLGGKTLEKPNDEIEFYELCRKGFYRSKVIFNEFYRNSLSFSGICKERLSQMEKGIRVMRNFYNRTGSSKIGFFYYNVLHEFHNILGDHEEAYKGTKKLLELIGKSPSLNKKANWVGGHTSHADNCILTNRLKEAKEYIQLPLEQFPFLSHDHLMAKDVEFLIEFYSKNFDNAFKITEQILQTEEDSNYPVLIDMFRYYKGVLELTFKSPEECLRTLNKITLLYKDEQEWQTWVRILRILALTEKGDHHYASSQIEALRKHLSRSGDPARDREPLIQKLLTALERNNFDFNKTVHREKELMDKLRSNSPGLAWKPKTPELILVPDWFENKAAEKAYSTISSFPWKNYTGEKK